jgi:hypothetical protein
LGTLPCWESSGRAVTSDKRESKKWLEAVLDALNLL